MKQVSGVFGSAFQFFREVKIELMRVEWPSVRECVGATSMVLFLVFLFAIFLGVIDRGLSAVIQYIFASV